MGREEREGQNQYALTLPHGAGDSECGANGWWILCRGEFPKGSQRDETAHHHGREYCADEQTTACVE